MEDSLNIHLGHFEHLVMLTLCFMVNNVLQNFINHLGFVYADKIPIFSWSLQEHDSHILSASLKTNWLSERSTNFTFTQVLSSGTLLRWNTSNLNQLRCK